MRWSSNVLISVEVTSHRSPFHESSSLLLLFTTNPSLRSSDWSAVILSVSFIFNVDNPVINFELFPNARKMVIYDNGKGIDKNISDKIFEPFVSNKPENEGRGMGLYIVSELLKDFGAIISLDDVLNNYGNKYKFVIEFLEE